MANGFDDGYRARPRKDLGSPFFQKRYDREYEEGARCRVADEEMKRTEVERLLLAQETDNLCPRCNKPFVKGKCYCGSRGS